MALHPRQPQVRKRRAEGQKTHTIHDVLLPRQWVHVKLILYEDESLVGAPTNLGHSGVGAPVFISETRIAYLAGEGAETTLSSILRRGFGFKT